MEQRIRQIMETEHLSQQDFAQMLEISASTLSNIFNGRTKATNNIVQAIHKRFPTIHVNWLLFGEGEMYDALPPVSPSEGISGETGAELPGAEPASSSLYNNVQESKGGNSSPDISLFSVMSGEASRPSSARMQPTAKKPVETSLNLADEKVKIIDNRPRKIKEIRVFYDDGTYESFTPS